MPPNPTSPAQFRKRAASDSESYLAPIRMWRPARLLTHLARLVAGEAAPKERVRAAERSESYLARYFTGEEAGRIAASR
jgi:hypothetical protein